MATEEPNASKSDRWQFSLRTLLVAVAFLAVACAALKFAGPVWWTILSACSLLLLMAAVVVALVDRGPRQMFAIGFIACVATYGLLLVMAPRTGSPIVSSREFNPYTGDYPTTKLLQSLFSLIVVESKYIDAETGEDFPMSSENWVSDRSRIRIPEKPPREDFMLIGHLLWTLLFGYIGGHFARFVYHRRASTRTR